MEENKFDKCFQQFASVQPDAILAEKANGLIERHFAENYTLDVLKQIYGCVDLTTLSSLDSRETVWKLVEKVNVWEGTYPDVPNVAGICTYPVFVETVKQSLLAKDVKIVSVAAGFPSSQTFPEVKVAETALAAMAGADEIDVVLNLGLFMEEAFEELTDELIEIRESCRGAKLKVILETGALATAGNIRKAAILAMYSGADFVKTSTGKGYPGATPEAVYILCQVIKRYATLSGRKVGIKVSGGIRTVVEAVHYYTLVKELLGKDWLNSERFRIGASALLSDIEKQLEQ
ncbi:MAG: deoxyribose-phosphate aldolase [Prevotellaceae bacterium]|jgi:deoxyribose-phosphate aldolase|nr:deoxyribose-phosphate aldolase [Prevotellaceae bacterium]